MGIKTGVVVFLFSLSSMASIKCESLTKDLRAMQAAQKQLMASFIRKNDTMAQVLEQNAKRLEAQMAQRRSMKRSDLRALRVAAQTFRGHDEKEKALVARFEKASTQLLDQVQQCLAKDERSFKKLGQR
jgi:hypothetical protein